jgi:hypothetical protein
LEGAYTLTLVPTASLFPFRLILAFGLGLIILAASAAKGQLQLSKPKAEKPLPNPYIIGATRDDVLAAVKQMLETREIPIDKEDCNQQTGECVVLSKSVIFIKGVVTTKSQLQHYCEVPAADVREWTSGRYVLRIQVSPADLKTCQVGVYAKFDGKVEGAIGGEWVPLASKGELEDKMLRCIEERVHGGECKDENK